MRLPVIALAVIYGVGYLYAASRVVRALLVMWTVRQARPYVVVFALLAPLAIAFYAIWLLPAWRPIPSILAHTEIHSSRTQAPGGGLF